MGIAQKIKSKRIFRKTVPTAPRSGRLITIIICQHLLLWTALYVMASTTYILIAKATSATELPCAVLAIVASSVCLVHLCLHQIAVRTGLREVDPPDSQRCTTWQWLATQTLRIEMTLWMVACGLTITFTGTRQALCLPGAAHATSDLDRGSTCIVQRVGILASLLALVACATLFFLLHKANEAFCCHLLGITKQPYLLPLMLPYGKPSAPPLFSDMSFKCRSSTTLTPSWTDSTTKFCNSKSEKALGLGIYAPRPSTMALMSPRPTLSSIRSHAISMPPPPSSPLPPLPVYLPGGRHVVESMRKPHPLPPIPKRSHRYRPVRRGSDTTVRIVPPSPILSREASTKFSRSAESLPSSSVYSCSFSSRQQSPLSAARSIDDFRDVCGDGGSMGSGSSSDIDDVATLHARLPTVRAGAKDGYGCWRRKEREISPLVIRKTMDEDMMISVH